MPLGLSRKEQWALCGTILVIVAAAGLHGYHATESAGGERIYVEGQGMWERVALIDAQAITGRPAGMAAAQRTSSTLDAAIDLNAATAEELDRLPGIGPARAQAVLELRQRVGKFRSVEDLEQVSGIGPATIERLRPYLRIGAGSDDAATTGTLVAPDL